MRTEFSCISVLRVASGPSVASCKCALNPRWFTLLTVLRRWSLCVSLTLCCFVVYSTRRFALCLTLCYFVLRFFSPFSIAITSLGEEIANLSAFRTFVQFALVWFCLFSLPLGVWKGLRFVIVVLPGLFSYLFLALCLYHVSSNGNCPIVSNRLDRQSVKTLLELLQKPSVQGIHLKPFL